MDPHVKSFGEHLADFRRLLVQVLVCLFIGISVSLPLAPRVYAWLKIPFERSGLDVTLRVTQVGGGFSVFLRVSLWSGLLLSFPVLVVLVALYLLPALHERERWLAWQLGGASFGLFLLGSWMAYHGTVPVALRFMTRVENWMETPAIFWEVDSYIRFVVRLLLAFGVAFQLPVLIVLLGRAGFVTTQQLRSSRRYVITGLSVLAMLLTPPDPFTMVLMALPLIVLFEMTIWLLVGMDKARPKVLRT
ncbi:MAG: twin-arginine translocase subunit TatC [Kiritimatiellia bacterium]